MSTLSSADTRGTGIDAGGADAIVGGVDLGKTRCRVRLRQGASTVAIADGRGAPGLADAGGVEAALDTVVRAFGDAVGRLASGAVVDAVGVGAAGASASPDAAHEFARRLRDATGARIALVNDALSAHAGAFSGGAGTVLIAGTGAVAVVVDSAGARGIRQIDGAGPWLGDEGSGQWIGRSGLAAVMRAVDGRGPSTVLVDAARELTEDLRMLPAWVARDGQIARQLGLFAPAVLSAASAGDPVASTIRSRAVDALVTTCRAAGTHEVAVVGGLTGDADFADALRAGLQSAGFAWRAPDGDALDGATLVALRSDLPYEGEVVRA
ncbi:N-acetylglucosamine kinase [uncultured Microbacterium sp.]|mgnify:CR=1 FL=1|uniref:N-acetylglucosamine kinase n=1 Tax=uncultured Microbacterium sp. TaxID=191216 RepID=UPI0025F0B757|nr:BadF/BadG/BcrA/BcrD ATPase family protein [uncultured Microbacterium sp.]